MANVTITPNMSLTVPVTGQEPGPNWANDLNNSLSIIDGHNHAPGAGVLINPDGIDINADLNFNSNNATNLRTARMAVQSSAITSASPDIAALYSVNGELYWNDTAGHQVPITNNGNVNAGAGSITNLPFAGAVTFNTLNASYVFEATATPTAANIDAATIIIRYPGSYPTPSGNWIALEAPSSLSTAYAFTLPATLPGSNGAFLTVSTAGAMGYTNVDNSTLTIISNVLQIKSQGITEDLLAPMPTGTSVGIGGFAISVVSSRITTTATGGSYNTITSVSIQTAGRPVYIALQPSGGGGTSVFNIDADGVNIIIGRSGTSSAQVFNVIATGFQSFFPACGFTLIDPVAAGTYNYTIQFNNESAGRSSYVQDVAFVAYEI